MKIQWLLGTAIVVAFVLILFIFLRSPIIQKVEPKLAVPGDIIEVTGQFLGRGSQEQSLLVGNQIITKSQIITWQPNTIRFRMPEGMRSGNLQVRNNRSQSKAVFLTNLETIPQPQTRPSQSAFFISLTNHASTSLWRMSLPSTQDIQNYDILLDGKKIDQNHILFTNAHSAELYLPRWQFLTEPFTFYTSVQELEQDIKSRISLKARTFGISDYSFDILPRRQSIAYGREGENKNTEPLYILSISFIDPDSTILERMERRDEFLLYLPMPEVDDLFIELASNFRGWLQLLPLVDNQVVLRLFPYNYPSGRIQLKVFGTPQQRSLEVVLQSQLQRLDFIGENQQITDSSSELAFSTGQNLLASLTSDYLEVESESFLSDELRSSLEKHIEEAVQDQSLDLESSITKLSPLDIVQEIASWFDNNLPKIQDNGEGRFAFIDELRRKDIPARERNGYSFTPDELMPRTWVEFFDSVWGWISYYGEELHDTEFYIPLEEEKLRLILWEEQEPEQEPETDTDFTEILETSIMRTSEKPFRKF